MSIKSDLIEAWQHQKSIYIENHKGDWEAGVCAGLKLAIEIVGDRGDDAAQEKKEERA